MASTLRKCCCACVGCPLCTTHPDTFTVTFDSVVIDTSCRECSEILSPVDQQTRYLYFRVTGALDGTYTLYCGDECRWLHNPAGDIPGTWPLTAEIGIASSGGLDCDDAAIAWYECDQLEFSLLHASAGVWNLLCYMSYSDGMSAFFGTNVLVRFFSHVGLTVPVGTEADCCQELDFTNSLAAFTCARIENGAGEETQVAAYMGTGGTATATGNSACP